MPVHLPRFTSIYACLLSICCASSTVARAADSKDIPGLIDSLADSDAARRQQAADALAEIGPPARQQIVAAARSDNPEIRAQAAQILRKLPWSLPTDPEEVQAALKPYGQADDSERAELARVLDLRLHATDVVLRLFNEEPSDSVRWFMTLLLIDSDDAILERLRKQNPPDDDGPGLLLVGEAWTERDRSKAQSFFRRAVEAAAIHPTSDSGILNSTAVRQLVFATIEAQDFNAAADLLRKQIPRERGMRRSFFGNDEMSSSSLSSLRSLHEYFGPLRGYAWDTQTWGMKPPKATVLAAMLTTLSPLGFTPPLPTGLHDNLSASQRYEAGRFLFQQGLNEAAEVELRRPSRTLNRRIDYNEPRRLILLSLITAARDDDNATAYLIERAFALKDRQTLSFGTLRSEEDLRAELHFRNAKIAHAAGDLARANREVAQLVDATPTTPDLTIAFVTWLKQTSRVKEAQTLFKRVYEAEAAALAKVESHKATARNDLAWLCARCGENLDEAVRLAKLATDEAPNIAAFLDTYAEAKYRTGQVEEAIKIETRAAELSPDTKFMKEQLARFKSGKP